MKYQIEFKPKALKTLKKIPKKDRLRIIEKIDHLKNVPRPLGSIQIENSDYYRIRCGNYRVIYDIQEKKLLVVVLKVGHRSDVYRDV